MISGKVRFKTELAVTLQLKSTPVLTWNLRAGGIS